MPTGRAGTSLGPGQGDHGGGEIVLGDGELTCARAEVGKHGKGGQPAQRPGHPAPAGSVDQARAHDAQPASPGRHLRRQLGPAVELTGPRIRRHRRQRDGPPNPAWTRPGRTARRCRRRSTARCRPCWSASCRRRNGRAGRRRRGHRTNRPSSGRRSGRRSPGPGTGPGDGPCTRPNRRQRRGPNPGSRWRR